MVVCDNCIPYLVCANVIVLPVPSLFSPPVLPELQQADLMTNEECQMLQSQLYFTRVECSDVVTVQRGKSPEVMSKTANILKRHGFVSGSRFLSGRLSRPSSIYLCYVVQWSLHMTL